MKRKICAIAAATALAITCLSGCGENRRQSDTVSEKNTFTYWVALPSNIATRVKSFNDVLMYQQREAETGVHIEFIHPSQGQALEQFNLMIASRELPDIIEYAWSSYQGGARQSIEDGMIIALNDYIDSCAPNFKKVITDKSELSEIYNKGSKTDEGDYFGFSNFNVGTARTFGGPVIRKDWLDELGLPVPETIDDWTAVLKAFKEKKGADAPFSATSEYFTVTNCFNGAFGVGQRLYLEGNKVKFGPLENGFKEYLALLNSWYREGLLDKDFSNNQRSIVDAKMTKGNTGATVTTLGAGMGVWLKQMQKEDPNYNLICVPYPVRHKGDTNDFNVFEGDVTGNSLAVTTECKNPEAVIKWIDYFYGDEGYMLLNFGVEGKTYNMVDGKPVYTDEILHNPDGLSINEALSLQCRATQSAPGLRQAPEYLEQYYEFPQQIEGFKMWSENVDNARAVTLPKSLSASPDENEELAALSTDINTYVEEMCLKFITGEEALDNYDQFVDTLNNKFNVGRYLEIEQAMYDRYLKR